MKVYNFGVIGCGRIAPAHIEAITNLKDAHLIGITDIITQKAEELGKKFNTPVYTNKELIHNPDVDVISICTPNGTHTDIAREALRAGKHVLIEKPLSLSLEDFDDLVKVAQQTQKKIFAVKQVRYNPPLIALKSLLEHNGLGKIYSASLIIRWNRPEKYYTESNWKGTKKMDGGGLLTQGIHYIDILQWLLGPVEKVFGIIDTKAHNIEIEDVANAILVFKTGVFANIEFTLCTYSKNLECSITLLGEKGSVKVGGTAVNELEMWDVENIPKPQLRPGLKPNMYASGLYYGSCPNHIFTYIDLIKSLNNEKNNAVNYMEARKTIEIIMAIYESAKIGKPVSLEKGK